MKKRLLFILVVIMGLHTMASAQQSIMPDISYTYLDKLIEIAKTNYPRVKANEARIMAAKATVSRANISYFDNITVSYVYQPQVSTVINGFTQTNSYNGFQAGIFFNLGTLLEKPFVVKEAKQQLEVANEEQQEYYLTLTNDVKKRYYTYIQAAAALKLQIQSCQNAENTFNDIKHKFEKGEQSFDNYSSAQSSLTSSYQSKIAAETNLLITKADLEELLGEKLEDIK